MDEVKKTATEEISPDYLADFRGYVRITTAKTKLDDEIRDLILAARADLVRVGVSKEKTQDEGDPLIKKAISAYVKAEFGLDNKDAETLTKCREMSFLFPLTTGRGHSRVLERCCHPCQGGKHRGRGGVQKPRRGPS